MPHLLRGGQIRILELQIPAVIIESSKYPQVTENTISYLKIHSIGLPRWRSGKESACNAGDPDSIPGLGRSPEERIGYPLQYFGAFLWLSW